MSRSAWGAFAVAAVGALIVIAAAGRMLYPAYQCAREGSGRFSAAERIAGCTAVISSGVLRGSLLALAYNNRGMAYLEKGDLDHAMADLDQAIGLNPNLAILYNNRGLVWRQKGNIERAIADYSRAIRFNARYALVYTNRGTAYWAKGDLDSAMADFDEAIRRDPKFARAYGNRGSGYAIKGDFDRAVADLDQAIRLEPTNAEAYFRFGRTSLYSGALPEAVSDLEHASELAPTSAYPALWLDIANRRSHRSSRLAEAVKQIDMTKWPAPVIELYLGRSTPAAVLGAADDVDAKKKKEQVCEANFYTGELALQQSRKPEAEDLLTLAVADCPKSFIEYEGALAELRALRRTGR